MGMSSETVRIVSSGSCLVRELWRVAAACGQTNAYRALTVHPIEKRIRHFLSRTRWNVLAERCWQVDNPWHSRILPCLNYVVIVYYQGLSGEFTGPHNGCLP